VTHLIIRKGCVQNNIQEINYGLAGCQPKKLLQTLRAILKASCDILLGNMCVLNEVICYMLHVHVCIY